VGDLNEFQTRKQKIDVLLKEQGWDVNDRSKIVLEVDTKQSDFTKQDYKRVNETRRNNAESKYADYLLLDSTGKPLAIIEAKRTTKDPLLGQKQAEEYADDIKAQTWNWFHKHEILKKLNYFSLLYISKLFRNRQYKINNY